MCDFASDAHDTLGILVYHKEKGKFQTSTTNLVFLLDAMRRFIHVDTARVFVQN